MATARFQHSDCEHDDAFASIAIQHHTLVQDAGYPPQDLRRFIATHTTSQRQDLREETVVAVIDAAEFEAARRNPRVRLFLAKADALPYLARLERQGRNR